MKSLITIYLLCFTVTTGCNIRPLEEGESGEIGRGVFYYQCINHTYDSACADFTTTPDFPLVMAKGAKFDMEFALDHNDGFDYLRVLSGSPNHISESAGVMTILQEGYSALFSVSGPNKIVDIVHLLGMPIEDVALVDGGWNGGEVEFSAIPEIILNTGETLPLRGVAVDEYGRSLAGLIDYKWTIDNEEVAMLGSNTTDSVFTLLGICQGSATLTVEVEEVVKQFAVLVKGESMDVENSDTELPMPQEVSK